MIKTILKIARFSKDGKLLEQREQESRSWLLQFIQLFYLQSWGAGSGGSLANVRDILNTLRTVKFGNSFVGGADFFLMAESTPGNTSIYLANYAWSNNPTGGFPQRGEDIGIVVGTDGGGVTPTSYKMGNKVNHGEGAGTLLYGGCELYGLTFGGSNGEFTIRRYFTNVAGGSIAVVEAGIYTMAVEVSTGYIFCIARDVFAAVTVHNGEILSVTYTPQITV